MDVKNQFDLKVTFVPRGQRTSNANSAGVSEGSNVIRHAEPKATPTSWKRRVSSWFGRASHGR